MVCYVRCDNYTFNVNSYNRNYNSHVIIGGPQLKIYHVTGLKLSKKAPKSVKIDLSVPNCKLFTFPIFAIFTKFSTGYSEVPFCMISGTWLYTCTAKIIFCESLWVILLVPSIFPQFSQNYLWNTAGTWCIFESLQNVRYSKF